MRTLTTISRRLWHRARAAIIGCTVTASFMMGLLGSAEAACPWIVQPYIDGEQRASEQTLVNIVLDGLAHQQQFFYGFTVTDIDLAWDLSASGTLIDLGPNGRALNVVDTVAGQIFEVDDNSIKPHTVYLAAARSPVAALEIIDAAIEPSRPFTVSYLKTRGATDVSGPLPTRSLPGVEIRASNSSDDISQWLTLHGQRLAGDPERDDGQQRSETTLAANGLDQAMGARGEDGIREDVQICAYQVAMR